MSEQQRHQPQDIEQQDLEPQNIGQNRASEISEHQLETIDAQVKVDAESPHIVGSDELIRREMSRRSRRSFLALGAAAVAGYGGWRWLKSRPDADGIPAPLRAAHQFNERLSESYFSSSRLAPEFPRTSARKPRVNGGEGMLEGFDPETWRLQVVGVANARSFPQYREDISYQTATDNVNSGDASTAQLESDDSKEGKQVGDANEKSNNQKDAMTEGGNAADKVAEAGLLLTLADIRALPRVEMTTELKCIEGWSVIVNWAGARLSDFAVQYQPSTRSNLPPDVINRPSDLVRYVSMKTPDDGYYVGLDMASALHPQTLLCYEMNGQPLSLEHGAPLRLVTPVKYGIKSIKRIGRIEFMDKRPNDFWAERGYDWYSGH